MRCAAVVLVAVAGCSEPPPPCGPRAATPGLCDYGMPCAAADDCASGLCTGGACGEPRAFSPAAAYPVGASGSGAAGLLAADLDGDGRLDLLTVVTTWNAAALASDVVVLLGDGDGRFAHAAGRPIEPFFLPSAIADLDGDGHLDLIGRGGVLDQNTVDVIRARGDGTFTDAVTYAAGHSPQRAAVADLDGDGAPDLVAPDSRVDLFGPNGGGAVYTLGGIGDGTFQPAVSVYRANSPVDVALGDLDGDGRADLVVSDQGLYGLFEDVSGSAIVVLPGAGDGSYPTAHEFPRPATSYDRVALGDLDGDGRLDVVALAYVEGPRRSDGWGNGPGGYNLVALRGDGTGALTESALAPLPFGADGEDLALADFDGDGHLDAAVAAGRVSVFRGRGDGTFDPPLSYAVAGAGWIATGDFDGDGRVDIAAVGGSPPTVGILLSRATRR